MLTAIEEFRGGFPKLWDTATSVMTKQFAQVVGFHMQASTILQDWLKDNSPAESEFYSEEWRTQQVTDAFVEFYHSPSPRREIVDLHEEIRKSQSFLEAPAELLKQVSPAHILVPG